MKIWLTAAGRELVDDMIEPHLANERRFLGALGVNDRERLAGTLRTLLEALDRPD